MPGLMPFFHPQRSVPTPSSVVVTYIPPQICNPCDSPSQRISWGLYLGGLGPVHPTIQFPPHQTNQDKGTNGLGSLPPWDVVCSSELGSTQSRLPLAHGAD